MTLFARIGTALYGERFIRPLAGLLEVDVRTVERWASGSDRMTFPPPGVWRELEAMVRAQNRESFALLEEIRKISLDKPTAKEQS